MQHDHVTSIECMENFDFGDPDEFAVDIVRYNPHALTHSLSRVPAALADAGPMKIGFSYPVERISRRPFTGMMTYLKNVADNGGRRKSGKYSADTNRSYASMLKIVAQALLLEGRPWEYIDDDILELVIQSMISATTRFGKPFESSTIAQVVETAIRCADYTNKIGMTAIELDRDALVAKAWRVSSVYDVDGKALSREKLEGTRAIMQRPMSDATIARMQGHMLMEPDRWVAGGPSSRPGLTFGNTRRCGFRLIENLGIHVEDVMNRTILDAEREYKFTLQRTKGAQSRDVLVPGEHLIRWQQYVRAERDACVKAAKLLNGSNWDEPVELLVNGLASGVHVGNATQPSAIQRDFRAVQDALSMYDLVEIRDADGQPKTVKVYWHCYHDGRHTYAHHMYRIARLRGGESSSDPIAFVQFRLGHAHRSTTMRIYLWPDRRKLALVGDMAVYATQGLIHG